MNAKDVKIGEFYGYGPRRVGASVKVKVRVTGTMGTPAKGKPQAFAIEKAPETRGWAPTMTEARHLRPWADCEAEVQAAQDRWHMEQARAQAQLDAWQRKILGVVGEGLVVGHRGVPPGP